MDTDVIVIGGGPTGLMLAAELRLGGANVILFERLVERSRESRGLGFTARAAELLQQRGLLERLENTEVSAMGHFGGIPMDYSVLEGSHFGVRGVPQFMIEQMLEERALELGVEVRRGHELTLLEQHDDHVRAIVHGPSGRIECTAPFLVGCDGGRSLVRQLAGFDFPGTDATCEMYLADVTGCDIKTRMTGELLPNGMVMAGPLDQGYFRIIVCENGNPPDRRRLLDFTTVADAWQRLTGDSIHHGRARWVSSFTDATRQASQYRRGPVLLAGDAAHIHLPAGGQGMSIGLQDAVNLGWKLAATVSGRAPAALLDTYHDERHPVGARVLRNTRAQGRLNLAGSTAAPLRSVVAELMALPEVARHLSGMVSGLDIRYPSVEQDRAGLGARMPDAELVLRDGTRERIAHRLRSGRGLLIIAEPQILSGPPTAAWPDRVEIVEVRELVPVPSVGLVAALLLRPDGHIAWLLPAPEPVGEPQPEAVHELAAALHRWFGVVPSGSGARASGAAGLTPTR